MKLTKADAIKELGLDESELTKDTVKKAYWEMARKHHPDLHLGDETKQEKMKRINEANDILYGLIDAGTINDVSDDYTGEDYNSDHEEYETYRYGFGFNRRPFGHVWAEKANADGIPYQFLYYEDYDLPGRHWDGAPVVRWTFINIETGKPVEIYSCRYWEEVEDAFGALCYPDHPDKIESRQYIIWNKSTYINENGDRAIRMEQASVPWQTIRFEYHYGLQNSSREEVIRDLMKKYCVSNKDPHGFWAPVNVEPEPVVNTEELPAAVTPTDTIKNTSSVFSETADETAKRLAAIHTEMETWSESRRTAISYEPKQSDGLPVQKKQIRRKPWMGK